VLVAAIATLRLVPEPSRTDEIDWLYERTSRTYAAEQ
jgi:hypothetical protein